MKRKIIKKTAFIMLVMYICSMSAFASLEITSAGACVMDFDTGDILYGYNETQPLVPASITKLITAYCVYDAVNDGRISMNDIVPVSGEIEKKCRNGYYEDGYMLYSNRVYTVDSLLDAALVCSVNAAAVVLAEYISGDEALFVALMRDTLNRLDIKAEIYDSYGISDENRISPYNLLKFARRFISDYPQVLKKTSQKSIKLNGKIYKSSNQLLDDNNYYDGIDGFKTGTTTAAGYCLCSTANRNGKRILAVNMHSETRNARFTDAVKLLDLGFDKVNGTDRYKGLYSTDINVYFNDINIPCYYLKGDNNGAVIRVDDMRKWGFDIMYSDEKRTLFAEYNPSAQENLTFDDLHYDKNIKISDAADSDIGVALIYDGKPNYMNITCNVKGNMYISIDELAEYFRYSWNNETKTASFGN